MLVAFVVLSFVLLGVGAYYLGVSNTQKQMTSTVTSTTIKVVTSTYPLPIATSQSAALFRDDFLFHVYLDKITYQYGEQVNLYYNLTYLGKSPRLVYLDESPFRIKVYNSSHSLVGSITQVPYYARHEFTSGMSITGKAVISGGTVRFEPYGSGGNVINFSPNSTYNIQGTVSIYNVTKSLDTGSGIGLTSPPLQILITEKTNT